MRYHYMDNLRALAMMSGLFFHGALAYSPFMDEVWLSADSENSVFLDFAAWLMHLFRMPLFFLITGFFAHYMIERRGVRGFLRNRALRILLPFLVFLPLATVAILAVCFYASGYLGVHTPLLDFVVAAVSRWPDGEGDFRTSHLWFLYSLIWFCTLAAIAYRFIPFRLAQHSLFRSPLLLFVVVPIILVPSLLGKMIPLPAPGKITPQLWAFGYFGVFFYLGWVYFKSTVWLGLIGRYWLFMVVACTIAYGFYYSFIPRQVALNDVLRIIEQPESFSWRGLLAAGCAAVVSVYGTLLCLFLGYKYLNKESRVLRYIADSSYWVYLVHFPLLIFIQMHLIHLQWPLLIKYLVGVFGTIAIGMVSYALLVRRTPIGWMLNGRQKKWRG